MKSQKSNKTDYLTALRIRELREGLGLSQRELAERMGLKQTAVSKYENQDRKPKVETLQKFADAFGVPLEFLRGDDLFSPGSPVTEIGPDDLAAQQEMLENIQQTMGSGAASAVRIYFDTLRASNKGMALYSVARDLDIAEQLVIPVEQMAHLRNSDDTFLLEMQLFQQFYSLNHTGREEAVKRVGELTQIPRYVDEEEE